MATAAPDYTDAFSKMSANLDIFVKEVKAQKSHFLATDQWTVKNVLCHIVFWHMYYAENYKALAAGVPPTLFNKPGYELNAESVVGLRKYSTKVLIDMLYVANKSLQQSIVVNKVPKMVYKVGRAPYTTYEFLDLVEGHLHTHAEQVRKAKKPE